MSHASSTSNELDPKDGFEIALRRFPESQMAQLYSQKRDGRFCDAVVNCLDGEFKAHRCVLATLCARDLAKPVEVPVKNEAVKRLANLCYTGYMKVSIENLEQDLKVAEALECEFVLSATQKWVTENVKQITATERALKNLDVGTVRGCLGRIKYMNEDWQDFLIQWAGSDPQRKAELALLQQEVEKHAFVSIYRHVVVGGLTMKFDGTSVTDEGWPIPHSDRIIIVNRKTKKRVNIAVDGTLSFHVRNKLKMTHSQRAAGILETVRPIILWLSDGSLLKVVDKKYPFEELGDDEKCLYQGPAWKIAPIKNACADLHLVPEHGAVLHYPGHGTCFMSLKTSAGFQAWTPMPCSDIHYAYSDGRRLILVSRDVHTYAVVGGDTFQTISIMISGGPRQSPFLVPSFCRGQRIVFAIVDLERSPKTFYFVLYEAGQSRVLSAPFVALPEARFSVM